MENLQPRLGDLHSTPGEPFREDKLLSSRIHGFSLLEILIITGLAMVLAAALVPRLLNSRIAANEATAIGNLDIITSAQESYKTAYPAIGYADTLSRLAAICKQPTCQPTPQHACLIDCKLPAATVVRS